MPVNPFIGMGLTIHEFSLGISFKIHSPASELFGCSCIVKYLFGTRHEEIFG
jgi:hypothetical protein